MRKVWILYLFIFLQLVACSDNKDELVGIWSPMEWTTDNKLVVADNKYVVSYFGDTISFVCKNYGSFWFSNAEIVDSVIEPNMDSNDLTKLDGNWFSASIVENEMQVVFDKNSDITDRTVSIIVTAGDIFDYFDFIQKGKDAKE